MKYWDKVKVTSWFYERMEGTVNKDLQEVITKHFKLKSIINRKIEQIKKEFPNFPSSALLTIIAARLKWHNKRFKNLSDKIHLLSN